MNKIIKFGLGIIVLGAYVQYANGATFYNATNHDFYRIGVSNGKGTVDFLPTFKKGEKIELPSQSFRKDGTLSLLFNDNNRELGIDGVLLHKDSVVTLTETEDGLQVTVSQTYKGKWRGLAQPESGKSIR